MAKILTQIEAHNIGNIRLYAGDAAELLAWAPPRSLARIDLIHPDPWPKRRHWKRRFVQDATVNAMARILKDGGEFRFVSDIDDYCAWTLAHLMRSSDFLWTAERAADWRQAVGRLHHDALRPQSRARGTRRGVFAVSAGLGVEANCISPSCPRVIPVRCTSVAPDGANDGMPRLARRAATSALRLTPQSSDRATNAMDCFASCQRTAIRATVGSQ